jgi:hypothetical protein
MRFLKSFLASIAFIAIVFTANANSSADPFTKDVRVEIKELIKDLNLSSILSDGENVVKINFMLNTDNEIIVLSTSDKSLDNVLKSNLNYKKIRSSELEQNKVYSIPVRLIK